MVRLLIGRLHLDDNLCKFRMNLPSKCFCCQNASGESSEHVFSTEQVALEIWSYFGALCGVPSLRAVLRARLVAW